MLTKDVIERNILPYAETCFSELKDDCETNGVDFGQVFEKILSCHKLEELNSTYRSSAEGMLKIFEKPGDLISSRDTNEIDVVDQQMILILFRLKLLQLYQAEMAAESEGEAGWINTQIRVVKENKLSIDTSIYGRSSLLKSSYKSLRMTSPVLILALAAAYLLYHESQNKEISLAFLQMVLKIYSFVNVVYTISHFLIVRSAEDQTKRAQKERTDIFIKSYQELMEKIEDKKQISPGL